LPRLRLEPRASVAVGGELRVGRSDPDAFVAPYAKLKPGPPGPGKSAADVARNQQLRIQAAMAELLAEEGYGAITVRGLAQCANVSTRTFYQCYAGKEECFLSLHRQVVRELLRRLAASQPEVGERGKGIRRQVGVLLDALSGDAQTARIVLVDAYTAGPKALEQARLAQRSIEVRVSDGCRGPIGASPESQLVVEGIVAGVIGMARSRLLTEHGSSLPSLSRDLSPWLLAYQDPAPAELPGLCPDLERTPTPSSSSWRNRGGEKPLGGEVELLLTAAAKLAAAGSPGLLNTRNILEAAGVSHRAFRDNFTCLEDCVVAAIEMRVGEALGRARDAGRNRSTPARRLARAVTAFCEEIALEPMLAELCFGVPAIDGIHKLSLQERVRRQIADSIDRTLATSSAGSDNGSSGEASVAACMGLLQNEVSVRGAAAAHGLTPSLVYLILAPAIGTVGALEVIREEHRLYEIKPGRSIKAS
jgi:AcrR family transcriptional regulator